MYPKKVDDKREITDQHINEIIENSSDGARYPVAIGHLAALGVFDDSKPAAGRFTNLRRSESGALIGDVQLREEVEKDFKDGAYPGWSVGIVNHKNNGGWHMDHLALLGSVSAAFKDLQEIDPQAFSFIQHNDGTGTIECFNSDGEKDREIWLVQSTPEIKQPAVNFRARPQTNGGQEVMELKELQDKMAAQNDELAQLRADKEALEAEKTALMKAKTDRLIEEFKGIKGEIINAAKDKGVTETARDELLKALDAYDAHYAGGIVSRELFDSLKKVISELKPKVAPGEMTDPDGDDDFELKSKFSGREAVNALYGNPEA